MQERSRYRPLKTGDFFVIIFFLSFFFLLPRRTGEKIIITVDKESKFVYPLSEDRRVEINGRLGISIITIKDNRVRMEESPCPLKLCERRGWIQKKGEQIICIPNRILIKIDGAKLDATTE